MTQEEKAKAYDEALKDMKVVYPNLRGDAKLAVEHAFPELKESEDERIRKVLCDIVRDMPYMETELRAHGLTVEKTLAYLEKQKEQKPAEWSEEDDAAHTRILGAVAKAFMGVLPTKPSEEDVHWLKTLPERFSLQPKTEWGKEEKGILLGCISALQNSGNWLLADKLKSLHPKFHWKPNEDQLHYLFRAVIDARKIHDASTSGYDAYLGLKSLWDDLQKLL